MSVKNESLLNDLKNKNLEAYKDLFFDLHGRLVLFAFKYTGDMQSAKDIVQDSFLKLWEVSENINTSPKAYLFQSVKNNSLNYLRHLKKGESIKSEIASKIRDAEKVSYSYRYDPYFSLLESEIQMKIRNSVDKLPKSCFEVFKLSRYEHLQNREIADKLNVSIKTVEKHISKALFILRKELSEYMQVILMLFFLGL